MTIEQFQNIIKENNIPLDAKLQSDSGWECGPTEMDGVYYNKKENTIYFTQSGNVRDSYYGEEDMQILYGINKRCEKCVFRLGNECVYSDNRLKKYLPINNTSDCIYFVSRYD